MILDIRGMLIDGGLLALIWYPRTVGPQGIHDLLLLDVVVSFFAATRFPEDSHVLTSPDTVRFTSLVFWIGISVLILCDVLFVRRPWNLQLIAAGLRTLPPHCKVS